LKIKVSINVVILMMAIGICTVVGGFTGSAFGQGDNQTNVGQGKNNTDSGNSMMDKIGDMAKEKIGQGLKDILGGGGSQ
jgi:L-cystine uptake protein TcyP (sodium:dicarboxylate symporter family)